MNTFSKTTLLIKTDIPIKWEKNLREYIKKLNLFELNNWDKIYDNLYDKYTLNSHCGIISLNAIKLCIKLDQYNIHTFPYIEKIATKGWSTSDGTYSFSMPLLNKTVNQEIYSFCSPKELIKKDVELDIWFNSNSWAWEIETKGV